MLDDFLPHGDGEGDGCVFSYYSVHDGVVNYLDDVVNLADIWREQIRGNNTINVSVGLKNIENGSSPIFFRN